MELLTSCLYQDLLRHTDDCGRWITKQASATHGRVGRGGRAAESREGNGTFSAVISMQGGTAQYARTARWVPFVLACAPTLDGWQY